MADSKQCRLCKTKSVPAKKVVALFSSRGVALKLAPRIGKLLEIPEPTPGDGHSSIICQKCNDSLPSLEKAVREIARLKDLAKSSLHQGVKRTRETGGNIGISPDTVRQRPRPKQARKRLTFEGKS